VNTYPANSYCSQVNSLREYTTVCILMMVVWPKHVVAITSEEEKNFCVDGPIIALLNFIKFTTYGEMCVWDCESKETLFWFVTLFPFYLTDTITQLLTNKITQLTHQPSLQKTALSEQHYCYDVVWCTIYWWTQHFQFILDPVLFKHSILHETSFQVMLPFVKISFNFTYRHLYIVLGRPHRKLLFIQPYPHNGLF
jgi:hypothetical protein